MNTHSDESLLVVAEWRAMVGKEEEVHLALQKLAEASRCEKGNLGYDIFVNSDDSRLFLLLEEYENAEALQVHRSSEHFRQIGLPVIEKLLDYRNAKSFMRRGN